MKTLVCFGDSNTHGTCPMDHLNDRRRLDRNRRWPGVLADRLADDWLVIEEGHPGRTTVHDDPLEGAHKNGLPAIQAILESHRPVDLVAILLGTNDLKRRFSVTGFDIARSVEKLVATARLSGSGPDGGAPQVMIIAPPPILETGCIGPMFAGGAKKSAEFGSHYGEAATRQDCAFLDAGAIIASSPVDGVHWDAEAHSKLGNAVADKVAAIGW